MESPVTIMSPMAGSGAGSARPHLGGVTALHLFPHPRGSRAARPINSWFWQVLPLPKLVMGEVEMSPLFTVPLGVLGKAQRWARM